METAMNTYEKNTEDVSDIVDGRITSRVPFRMPQQQKKKRKREECRRTSGAEPVCSWAQVEKICDCHREMESYLIIDTAYV